MPIENLTMDNQRNKLEQRLKMIIYCYIKLCSKKSNYMLINQRPKTNHNIYMRPNCSFCFVTIPDLICVDETIRPTFAIVALQVIWGWASRTFLCGCWRCVCFWPHRATTSLLSPLMGPPFYSSRVFFTSLIIMFFIFCIFLHCFYIYLHFIYIFFRLLDLQWTKKNLRNHFSKSTPILLALVSKAIFY